MDRIKLIQFLIDKYQFTSYLEIGTQKGISFFPIRCRKKIAVDPKFRIRRKTKLEWNFRNFYNLRNDFFEMTSDEFFQNKKSFLKKLNTIDIVLIDGLHTFRGTLNDALNSLKYLSTEGIIVLHDCFPPHTAAALYANDADEAIKKYSDHKEWTGEWCGDTWKAIAYLKRKYPEDLEISVLDLDYGLGILKIKKRSNLATEIDENLFLKIDQLEYKDLIESPESLINLRKANYYQQI